MIDLEKISRKSLIGKLLRFPLNLISPEMKMTILSGKLRGKKWIAGAGRNGCWLGTYEYENQVIFEQQLTRGNIVFDIGAHAGFFTLLASVLVGESGKVFAFEPSPRNLVYLKEHLKLNKINNVTIIEAAVSKFSGKSCFNLDQTGYQGGISVEGNFEVETVSLDELIANGKIPVPNYLKIDVEGHEKSVLLGAKSLLANHHPTIFLSIHGRPVFQQCSTLLTSLDYRLEIVGQNRENSEGELPKNLDLIAGYERL